MSLKTEIVKLGKLALEHSFDDEVHKDVHILFVHSSGHGSWMWKNFLAYFGQKQYDAWAINLRGHYLSDSRCFLFRTYPDHNWRHPRHNGLCDTVPGDSGIGHTFYVLPANG